LKKVRQKTKKSRVRAILVFAPLLKGAASVSRVTPTTENFGMMQEVKA